MLPASLDVNFWLPHRSSLTLIGINHQSNHSLNWRSLHLRLWNQRLSPQKLFTGCCSWCRKAWRYQKGNIAFGSYIRQVGGFYQAPNFLYKWKTIRLRLLKCCWLKINCYDCLLLCEQPSLCTTKVYIYEYVIVICWYYNLIFMFCEKRFKSVITALHPVLWLSFIIANL